MDILFSFGPPDEESNPYVRLLLNEVSRQANVHYFSWKYALLGSYDVFHVHWPETLIRRTSLKGRLVCRMLLALLMVKLAASGTPVVRTEHNLRPHESGSLIEAMLLAGLDRQAARWVVMNAAGSLAPTDRARHIPHGHYKDWYKLEEVPVKKTGSILNFGLIRPYKGVEDLIDSFNRLPASLGLSLTIMGKPQNEQTRRALLARIALSPGITGDIRHIPEGVLAQAVAEAELVVLPYRAMHNSGALLMALSLGTPVLVPQNAMTDALAAEVGEEWVHRFNGLLTPEAILNASKAAAELRGSPNLSARDWSIIGDQHLDLYRLARPR